MGKYGSEMTGKAMKIRRLHKILSHSQNYFKKFYCLFHYLNLNHNIKIMLTQVQPLAGATISAEGLTKTANFNLTGRYNIRRFEQGTYNLTCTHAGSRG